MNFESMKAVIIGAGNVGTHMALALHNEGVKIIQIASRSMKNAVELASKMQCSFTTDLDQIRKDADIYFVCVSDDAVQQVIRQLDLGEKLIIHTSGSVDIDVFYDNAQNYGVMYPMQTFSKFKEINYAEIPVFIEANSNENEIVLYNFIKKISPKVTVANSQQRRILHLCAVIASNFTNHMCTLAEMLLKENQLSFDTFKPLMRETLDKIMKYSPYESQTGPAVRHDEQIVNKHIEVLDAFPQIQEVYKTLSNSIMQTHKKVEK